jgi:diguanylate cyclase (GGDEF)-like protein
LSHNVVLIAASIATVVTLWLLVDALTHRRGGAEEKRDRREHPDRDAIRLDPTNSITLVGNALAATHNPRALLPAILDVVSDATGARGARIVERGVDVVWTGDIRGRDTLVFELALEPDAKTELVLHPPVGGFDRETRELAEWLAAQAGVALANARTHHVLRSQAVTDDLTGLDNRRRFDEALDNELVRSRTFGSPLSLLLVDLDNFKVVNDEFGHQRGDEVLRRTADLIREHLRDADIAARLGGDEFAIIAPDTGSAGAVALAERLRRSFRRLHQGPDLLPAVTASFGVAECIEDEPAEAFLSRADHALYEAKRRGRDCVALASVEPRRQTDIA